MALSRTLYLHPLPRDMLHFHAVLQYVMCLPRNTCSFYFIPVTERSGSGHEHFSSFLFFFFSKIFKHHCPDAKRNTGTLRNTTRLGIQSKEDPFKLTDKSYIKGGPCLLRGTSRDRMDERDRNRHQQSFDKLECDRLVFKKMHIWSKLIVLSSLI